MDCQDLIELQSMPPYMKALNSLLADFLKKYKIPKPKIDRPKGKITLLQFAQRYEQYALHIDSRLKDEDAKRDFEPLRAAMLDIRGADASGDELTHTSERLWFYVHIGNDEIFAQRIYAVGGGLYRKPVFDGAYHYFSNGVWKHSWMMSYGKRQGDIGRLSYASALTIEATADESVDCSDILAQAILMRQIEDCMDDPIFVRELRDVVERSLTRARLDG